MVFNKIFVIKIPNNYNIINKNSLLSHNIFNMLIE